MSKLDVLVFDAESYYCSKTYTLRKMSGISYVRDPRFKAHGAAFKLNKEPAYWVTGQSLAEHLAEFDWTKTVVVGHNMPFDGLILSHHYGVIPRTYVDTLGMARAVLGGTIPSLSLDALGQHFGHGGKLGKGEALDAVNGVRDITPEQEEQLALYACEDAELTHKIFGDLWKEFPTSMLDIVDWTIRMITEPTLMLNADIMRKVHEDEVEMKRLALANCGLTRPQLNSNPKLASVLIDMGIDPPLKTSRTTGKTTYAFSKQDQEFTDLQDHPDRDVRDVVIARLAVKSSIEETRSRAYLDLADGTPMPVPLRAFGAMQTGRLSGDQGLNCFSGDHELLTPSGWQRIDAWEPTTPVMQWSRSGRMEFVRASRKIDRHHSGYCVAIEARTVSALVTPEHRFANVKFPRSADRTAQDLIDGRGFSVPLTGVFDGAGSGLTEDQARFMVALAADGSRAKRNWSFGFKRERKITRMRALLRRLGATFREVVSSQGATCFYVAAASVPFASKGYGAWVLSLLPNVADALLDEVRHWDGFSNSRSGAAQFATQYEDQAVWVSTIARLRGVAASVSSYERPTSTGRMYYVYFGKSRTTRVDPKHAQRVPYAGAVYCLTVPSSYVLVKRGTKIYVSGQCQNIGRNSGMREGVEAPDGYVLVESDLSNIELRVAAKIAHQFDILATLAAGGDSYSDFAGSVFNTQVTKALAKANPVIGGYRQTGKVGMLSCLAEGTEVLTSRGLKRIEHVADEDLLWDGIEWVAHGGVVCNGVRHVIRYDGLTATPDHRVFLEDGREVDFVAAEVSEARLARTGAGAQPLRLPDCFVERGPARSHTPGEHAEPREHGARLVERGEPADRRLGGEPLRAATHGSEVCEARDDRRADHRAGPTCGAREAKELAWDRSEARVYDILNAGPRNRFTANGRLVHNCQYGVGAKTFQQMLWVQAGLRIDLDEAERIVKHYRKKYVCLPDTWKSIDRQLAIMANGQAPRPIFDDHPFVWDHDSITLPSGFKIKYPDLRWEMDPSRGRKQLVFTSYGGKSGGKKFLWGGSCLENLSQAMAREIIDPMVRAIRRRYVVALQVHDSVLCVVPREEADEAVAWVRAIMSTPPTFWPDLPVSCECGWGLNYGAIKKT